jgi:hypothetical protein
MKQPGALIVLFAFVAAVSFTLASEQEGGKKLKATLTGAAEVPGPGDADGTGAFTATLNPGQNQVCYELRVSNIGAANAAHIHTGGPTVAGSVLLNLKAPANGSSKECATLDREKVLEIIKTPEKYYVNVHNADFPDGAVRGQLTK